ncbi:hypothetical protein FRUB_06573 [Fimbriiglobus ruber]|uniref:Uncharacterized protein n=1 Tax=Fimbriiglobus ruber TaxID=1908690 RepID=A0A225D902_9BACT|nr:hypothetical protein FRUB_06573 [Fimbriiglobus ruber]
MIAAGRQQLFARFRLGQQTVPRAIRGSIRLGIDPRIGSK